MFRHSYFTQSSALDNVLSHDALRRVVPSAFAEAPHASTSERYSFLPTTAVISRLEEHGWVPVAASQSDVRDESKKGFQSHMIRFAQLSDLRDRPHVEVRPEIAYINSHDKSRAARLEAGLLRFACANGLIVSDGSVAGLRFKHFGVGTGELDDAVIQITAKAPALFEAIEQWRARKLSETEQREFARRAIDIRWPAKKPVLDPVKILLGRRGEDAGENLWRTFNVAQENLLRGGLCYRTAAFQRASIRAVSGITETVRINKSLWALTEEFSNN